MWTIFKVFIEFVAALLLFFYFFWSRHVPCGNLVPRPGIEPMSLALGVWSLNHWTAREVPVTVLI